MMRRTRHQLLAFTVLALMAGAAMLLSSRDQLSSAHELAPDLDRASKREAPSLGQRTERGAERSDAGQAEGLEEPFGERASSSQQARLRVHLVDGDESPVCGAWVLLASSGEYYRIASDADGLALFEGLEAGGYDLAVLGKEEMEHVSLGRGEQVERVITMEGETVLVRVVGENGLPVEGAQILISTWASEEGYLVGRTDADGKLSLENLQSSLLVEARAAGYQPAGRFRMESEGVTISLERGGASIRGRVVDRASGQGLKDARVTLRLPQNSRRSHRHGDWMLPLCTEFTAVSDEEGLFSLDCVYERPLDIWITHSGFAPLADSLDLPASRGQFHQFELTPAHALRGLIVDQQGQVVPDCYVRAMYSSRLLASTRTDALGSFLLSGLCEGQHTVVATKHGVGSARVDLVPSENEFIELELSAKRAVMVTILDEEGQAIPEARLCVMRPKQGLMQEVWITGNGDGECFFLVEDQVDSVEAFVFGSRQSVFPAKRISLEVGTLDRILHLPLATEGELSMQCSGAVHISQAATGYEKLMLPDDKGQLSLAGLPPGDYLVDFAGAGPDAYERIGTYTLHAGEQLSLGFVQPAVSR